MFEHRARRIGLARDRSDVGRGFHRADRRSDGQTKDEVAHEYHTRPDKADNILLSVDAQVKWLQEIGFAHADCYFRFLELAVFGGVKPSS